MLYYFLSSACFYITFFTFLFGGESKVVACQDCMAVSVAEQGHVSQEISG